MSEMRADLNNPEHVVIVHDATGTRWTFRVEVDRSGRRRLDGPHGPVEAMVQSALMQHACIFAQSEALHAGSIDY